MRPFWISVAATLFVIAAFDMPARANQVRTSSPGQTLPLTSKCMSSIKMMHRSAQGCASQPAPYQTGPTPTATLPINMLSIESILIYHQVAGQWRRATVVRLGQRVRFVVQYSVLEYEMPCGTACVPTGTIAVTKNGQRSTTVRWVTAPT